jgi:Ca-activated chloride channel homolog
MKRIILAISICALLAIGCSRTTPTTPADGTSGQSEHKTAKVDSPPPPIHGSVRPSLPAQTPAPTSAADLSTLSGGAMTMGLSSGEGRRGRSGAKSRGSYGARAPQAPPGYAMREEMEEDTDDEAYRQQDEASNTERYGHIIENPFREVTKNPLSTFSIDVDTAAYSNMRRYITSGSLPPPDAVRIEELINYFNYNYPPPSGDDPFSADIEIAPAPWNDKHRLVRIGLRGKAIDMSQGANSNLVFLLDVSGSMNSANKLPLLKKALKMVVDNLGEKDRVAIVVYAGASGLVLPSTSCGDRNKIAEALGKLSAGGSTNAGSGIQLAYKIAKENFIKGGINRVILATDGDFNVGMTNEGDLVRMIEKKAKSNIFLTVLGFGMGNYNDSTLEKLANKGNGNYAYIDTLNEARKVLVEEIGGTLITIAKDVKIQIEFNPAKVGAYRLIGYENRMLRAQDFNDDTKDAGEIGAGHTVTALYEIVPAGQQINVPGIDPLKYQAVPQATAAAAGDELLTLKIRYKKPDGDTSKLLEFPVTDAGDELDDATDEFKFAASVASFGMLLRGSKFKGDSSFDDVIDLAEDGSGDDRFGYRAEFIGLVKAADKLSDN